MKEYITVIGGGLAGCEAAYQISKRGISVKLYEMKPAKFSPAHSNTNLAEISNNMSNYTIKCPFRAHMDEGSFAYFILSGGV